MHSAELISIEYNRLIICNHFYHGIWLHLNFRAIIYAPNKYFLIMCIYLNFISTSLVCIDIQCYTPYCLQRMATKKPISSWDRVERNLRYLCPEAMLFLTTHSIKNTTTQIILPTYVKPKWETSNKTPMYYRYRKLRLLCLYCFTRYRICNE